MAAIYTMAMVINMAMIIGLSERCQAGSPNGVGFGLAPNRRSPKRPSGPRPSGVQPEEGSWARIRNHDSGGHRNEIPHGGRSDCRGFSSIVGLTCIRKTLAITR
jgi:hypothetical protein